MTILRTFVLGMTLGSGLGYAQDRLPDEIRVHTAADHRVYTWRSEDNHFALALNSKARGRLFQVYEDRWFPVHAGPRGLPSTNLAGDPWYTSSTVGRSGWLAIPSEEAKRYGCTQTLGAAQSHQGGLAPLGAERFWRKEYSSRRGGTASYGVQARENDSPVYLAQLSVRSGDFSLDGAFRMTEWGRGLGSLRPITKDRVGPLAAVFALISGGGILASDRVVVLSLDPVSQVSECDLPYVELES